MAVVMVNNWRGRTRSDVRRLRRRLQGLLNLADKYATGRNGVVLNEYTPDPPGAPRFDVRCAELMAACDTILALKVPHFR